MYCIYCGKPTEGENEICHDCAVARGYAPQPVQPEPAPQPAEPETFVLNSAATPVKKKAKALPTAAIIAGVAVIAIVLIAVFCWDGLQGFFLRTFSSPQKYLLHVEQQATNEIIDLVGNVYGDVLDNMTATAAGGDAQMHLLVGDSVLSLLESSLAASGMDADLSWLSDIALDIQSDASGDQLQVELGIGLGQNNILTASSYLDFAQGAVWAGIPQLSESYIKADLTEAMGDDFTAAYTLQKQALQDLCNSLPSESKMKELLRDYLDIVLTNITKVTKSSTVKELGGNVQKLTALTAQIYEKDALRMATQILTALKFDVELKNAIVAIMVYAETADYGEAVPESIKQEYLSDLNSWIDDGLQELKDEAEYCDEDSFLTIEVLADKDGTISGLSILVDEYTPAVHYLTVRNGDNFAFEADLDSMTITGSGTSTHGKLNGEFSLSSYGTEAFTVKLTDWDEDKAMDGHPCGTITLVPGEYMLDEIMWELGDAAYYLLGSAEPALQIELETSDKTVDMSLHVLVDEDSLLGLTLASKRTGAGKISVPADGVDAMDEEALMQWVTGMDFETVLNNMTAAGVPSEYVDMLESAIEMLQLQLVNYG